MGGASVKNCAFPCVDFSDNLRRFVCLQEKTGLYLSWLGSKQSTPTSRLVWRQKAWIWPLECRCAGDGLFPHQVQLGVVTGVTI
jgi:hypothetical protein